MDHTFTPSVANPTQCARCKRGVMDHTDMAVCECCPNTGKMNLYVDILMCDSCYEKELAAVAARNAQPKVEPVRESIEEFKARVDAARAQNVAAGIIPQEPAQSGLLNINNLVDKAREVTSTITSRPDIFTAGTIELHKVYTSIDEDASVGNKQYKKAEYTKGHIETLQKVIFDANQQIIDANNRMRAAQGELNRLVISLREEERAKLGIVSPEYKPQAPKTPKAASKPRGSRKQKFDKKELMDIAEKLQKEGLPVQWSMLQTICVARDMTPTQAAEVVRKQMGV